MLEPSRKSRAPQKTDRLKTHVPKACTTGLKVLPSPQKTDRLKARVSKSMQNNWLKSSPLCSTSGTVFLNLKRSVPPSQANGDWVFHRHVRGHKKRVCRFGNFFCFKNKVFVNEVRILSGVERQIVVHHMAWLMDFRPEPIPSFIGF